MELLTKNNALANIFGEAFNESTVNYSDTASIMAQVIDSQVKDNDIHYNAKRIEDRFYIDGDFTEFYEDPKTGKKDCYVNYYRPEHLDERKYYPTLDLEIVYPHKDSRSFTVVFGVDKTATVAIDINVDASGFIESGSATAYTKGWNFDRSITKTQLDNHTLYKAFRRKDDWIEWGIKKEVD